MSFTSKLTIFYRDPVIGLAGTAFALMWRGAATEQRRRNMKIYLLLLLIGTLLTAIRFTSVPEKPSETLPQ
jgi:hypothetical protein